MAKSARETNPRRTGNLFTIDARAVSLARELSSRELSAKSVDSSSNESFFFDRFSDLTSTSQRPSILRSSLRTDDSMGRKRPRGVSFADSIETVHVVDNLKFCLTMDEKRQLWEMAPESSSDSRSGNLSALENALFDVFCLNDEPTSARKDNKRRRRKTQSKLRNINNNYSVAMEQSPTRIMKKNTSLSPMRSLTSRLGFRKQAMHTGILVPLRD